MVNLGNSHFKSLLPKTMDKNLVSGQMRSRTGSSEESVGSGNAQVTGKYGGLIGRAYNCFVQSIGNIIPDTSSAKALPKDPLVTAVYKEKLGNVG